MIPRSEGPGRPLSESIAACEAHRDRLHNGYLQSIVDGRAPTQDEADEHRRREREARTVSRQRAKFAVQRAARRVVLAEYKRWLNE
ncbi:hypothetical protein [Streptomyces poriferorum]|uniref:Uncharacterized protein n=1 Tax=Streptomyces poriferorum TaxID=2798799 RepID=A0ABY9IY22_9ACTN|nr:MULTISPECIES: hypothetical protein [unclassified Streptomyces]MDP5310453.1 hypothetical protein [Streptomyces sp. Alt4]WLQ60393.1 hypothetical protein P8A19_35440 [Streptomyces sp. Alt2]